MKTTDLLISYMGRGVAIPTQRNDRDRLECFCEQHPEIEQIDSNTIDNWFSKIEKRLETTSVYSHKQTFKAFFTWCVNRKIIEKSPADHLKVKKRTSARHKAANEDDVLKVINGLMELADRGNPRDIRDLLAFKMAYDSGNRRGELVTLSTKKVEYALRTPKKTTDGIVIYETLGDGKIGAVPLRFTEFTGTVYRMWQEVRPKRKSPHKVFVALYGNSPGEPMTPDGFSSIFVKRCQEFGVPVWRTHSFRHLKGNKVTDAYSPRVAAQVLGITVETAIMHYYDVAEQAVIDAITI